MTQGDPARGINIHALIITDSDSNSEDEEEDEAEKEEDVLEGIQSRFTMETAAGAVSGGSGKEPKSLKRGPTGLGPQPATKHQRSTPTLGALVQERLGRGWPFTEGQRPHDLRSAAPAGLPLPGDAIHQGLGPESSRPDSYELQLHAECDKRHDALNASFCSALKQRDEDVVVQKIRSTALELELQLVKQKLREAEQGGPAEGRQMPTALPEAGGPLTVGEVAAKLAAAVGEGEQLVLESERLRQRLAESEKSLEECRRRLEAQDNLIAKMRKQRADLMADSENAEIAMMSK